MKVTLPIFFVLLTTLVSAQVPGEWTWMSGSNSNLSPAGVFGTMGVPAPGNRPPGLYEACEWTDQQGNFWLFGGQSGTGLECALWRYEPSTNLWTWMNGSSAINQSGIYGTIGVPSPLNRPGARGYGALSWVDSNGNLWMFGGVGYGSGPSLGTLGDLWRYNIASNQWTWMSGTSFANGPASYGQQGVPSPSNNPPGRSETAAAWYENNCLWMFGGMDAGSLLMNDLWKYDLSTNQWTWITGSSASGALANYGTQGVAAPSNDPGSREVYAHWKDHSGSLWIFGGETFINQQTYQLGDMWKYEIATNMWTWIDGSIVPEDTGYHGTHCDTSGIAQAPAQTETRSCWTDTCGNFWLYGGALMYAYSNLWCYKPESNEWIFVTGSGALPMLPVYGTQGVSSPANHPGGKTGALPFTDRDGNLWLFGGGNGFALGDLWRFVPDYNCIGGCRQSDTIPEPVDDSLFIPNVFSPNGNGVNDEFEIVANGFNNYDVVIFDRWGVEVFHSTSSSLHWNGKLNNTGKECTDGTYYYILRVNDQAGITKRYTGFLTLIR